MGNVYKSGPAAKAYKRTHEIAAKVHKALIDEVFRYLPQENNKSCRILDAGIGDGSIFAIPILKRAIKEGRQIELVGFDSSDKMLAKLKSNLENAGFTTKEKKKDRVLLVFKNKTMLMQVHNCDLEEGLPGAIKGKFDLCLAILILHHLTNWRLGLANLLKRLAPDGCLVLFEWAGDMKLREGNFFGATKRGELVKFWRAYYTKREEYAPWYPEISATDYSAVFRVLDASCAFKRIRDVYSEPYNLRRSATYKEFLTWISNGVYSNYFRGLTEAQRADLAKYMQRYADRAGIKLKKAEEKLRCRLVCYKRKTCRSSPGDDEGGSETIRRSILASVSDSSGQELMIWRPDKAGVVHLAYMLLTHDCFTRDTVFFVLNQWNLVNNSWREGDQNCRPVVLFNVHNKEAFNHTLGSYLFYAAAVNRFKYSVTDFIFRDLERKPALDITRGSMLSIKQVGERFGMGRKLEITLPKNLLGGKFTEEANKIADKAVSKLIKKGLPGVPLGDNAWNLNTADERFLEAVKSINTDSLEVLRRGEKLHALRKKLAGLTGRRWNRLTLEEKKRICDVAALLALHFLFARNNWSRIRYLPSKACVRSDRNGKVTMEGFGGVVLCENVSGKEAGFYSDDRTRLVGRMSEIFFRGLGASGYAEKVTVEITKTARRAAAAAILVESYAHNIGAHSLSGLRELVEEWRKRLAVVGENPRNSDLAVTAWAVANLEKLGQDKLAQAVRNYIQFSEYVWYLEGKSAFWNAVTGDRVYGGELRNLWWLLDCFAKNNLFCGSLCATELHRDAGTTKGISGIELRVYVGKRKNCVTLGVSNLEDDMRFRFEEETGEDNGRTPEEAHEQRVRHVYNNPDEVKKLQKNASLLRKWLRDGTYPDSRSRASGAKRKSDTHVYLPGGIVGAHAFYTILENVVRNVKHCKVPQKGTKPLPLCIRIKEEEDQFALTVWLDLDLVKIDGKPPDVKAKRKEILNWPGILGKDDSPQMGGTSQTILCAGLLLGLDYEQTEAEQLAYARKEQGSAGSGSNKSNGVLEPVIEGNKKKRLAYRFRLWKGADIKPWSELKDKPVASLGRYRIIVAADEEEKKQCLETTSAVRRLIQSKIKLDFPSAYELWLTSFVCTKEHWRYGVAVKIDDGSFAQVKGQVFRLRGPSGNPSRKTKRFYFVHGGGVKCKGWGKPIQFKSHIAYGPIISGKLKDAVVKANCATKPYWCELLEIVAVKIAIVDDRLWKAYNGLDCDAQKVLSRLGVQVVEESPDKLDNLTGGHFLVVHLSFLQTLAQAGRAVQAGKDAGTAAVQAFLSEHKKVASKYDFLVVTTGRSRDWWSGLEPDEKRRVRYVPIENLKACFRDGPKLNSSSPGAGVKFALVKAVLGS